MQLLLGVAAGLVAFEDQHAAYLALARQRGAKPTARPIAAQRAVAWVVLGIVEDDRVALPDDLGDQGRFFEACGQGRLGYLLGPQESPLAEPGHQRAEVDGVPIRFLGKPGT